MTQVRVKFHGAGYRHPEEIVDGNKTIREYLEEKDALMSAQFTVNGAPITGSLDMKLNDLYTNGIAQPGSVITLSETAKSAGA